MSRRRGLCVVYPAKEVVVVACAVAGGGVDVLSAVWNGSVRSCCGGSVTVTPVRECRRGGIIESDWDVGVRMRRRRGLVMCFVCEVEVEGFAGRFAEAVGVMVGWLRVVRESGGVFREQWIPFEVSLWD